MGERAEVEAVDRSEARSHPTDPRPRPSSSHHTSTLTGSEQEQTQTHPRVGVSARKQSLAGGGAKKSTEDGG